MWYRDAEKWVVFNTLGIPSTYFDLIHDPLCQQNLVQDIDEATVEKIWKNIILDAKGEIPDYSNLKQTDAIGQELTPDNKNQNNRS